MTDTPPVTVESPPSAPPDAAPHDEAKSIILFSDGTGNSSAKLFKTNVWRMYEAVDLGPASSGKRKQTAFYDNGVGTSALRPLAMLGGIFGFGLKRNILEIYRYACRNYRPGPRQLPGQEPDGGDDIYGFGFSRGAFTIRLVIALIASEGLVISTDEAELKRKSEDAYRAFRAAFLPRKWQAPTRFFRAWRQKRSDARRRRNGTELYDSGRNYRPVIRFLGVWDTVAAYGGPVTELTRAIDNWIFALSMPDYQLSDRVRCARHALAIDDERDAFHPLLWDEVHEERAIRDARNGVRPLWIDENRLRQVWFTGMHADVGGGYPDESLSYVSFLWIMEEAEKAGLRMLKVITDRFRALANSSGPLHDSRSGPGAYYRYQPRRISTWLHPPDPATLIQFDPERTIRRKRPLGFLKSVNIHESVAARIASGTDRYAPFTFPRRLNIVPPQQAGETALQADSATPSVPAPESQPARPMISPETRRLLEDPAGGRARVRATEQVWDWVWHRRIIYFASLAATILLVSLPWALRPTKLEELCSDDRCVLRDIIGQLKIFLPGFAEGWVDGIAARPVLFLVLVAFIVVLLALGKRKERRLRDHSLKVWDAVLGRGEWPAAKRSRSLRRDRRYRRLFRSLKWVALPSMIAIAIFMAALYLAGAGATQLWLIFGERGESFCGSPDPRALAPAPGGAIGFSAGAPCTDLNFAVAEGGTYEIRLLQPSAWRDAGYPATPASGVTADTPWYMDAMSLYRRVIGAPWMKPLIEIRIDEPHGWAGNLVTRLLGPRVKIRVAEFRPQPGNNWAATFTAERSGRLYLMLNDAALPFHPGAFYGNNEGRALVTVRQLDPQARK